MQGVYQGVYAASGVSGGTPNRRSMISAPDILLGHDRSGVPDKIRDLFQREPERRGDRHEAEA